MATKNLGTCDFCLAENKGDWWEFPCKPFIARSRDGSILHQSDGPWGACRTCRDLVETGQFNELAKRAVDMVVGRRGLGRKDLPRRSPHDRLIATLAVKMVHTTFMANRQGPSVYHPEPRAPQT